VGISTCPQIFIIIHYTKVERSDAVEETCGRLTATLSRMSRGDAR